MTETQKAPKRTAVRTTEVAEILLDWRESQRRRSVFSSQFEEADFDMQHTVAWLSERSGVGKREIRRILKGGTGTTSEVVFDALMSAIERYDLYHLLERVEDGRSAANRQRKFSCAPSPAAAA